MDRQIGFSFGARSGVEKVSPIAIGDTIVKHNHSRYVVIAVDSNSHGAVYVCVNLSTGNDAIVLESEIAYRSC